jgi:hypothetical protein
MRVLLSAGLLLGRVDSGCARQFRRGGRPADEALAVSGVGRVQDLGALGLDGFGVAVVDVGAVCRPSPPWRWSCCTSGRIPGSAPGRPRPRGTGPGTPAGTSGS